MSSRIVFLGTALLVAGAVLAARGQQPVPAQPTLGTRTVKVLDVDGVRFKDLNKNGRLDTYEDWRKGVDARVDDLVSQMTLEEKAGLMVSPTLTMGANGTVNEEARTMPNPFGGPSWTMPGTSDALVKLHIRQFINRANTSPRTMVGWLNGVQAIAETSRLGIPAFFVTNPRNHLGSGQVIGIDEAGGSFSQWPGTLGLAAMRDLALVEAFSRISAEEHVAVGIRGAYHPQIDLATEPRWARISGTFGEDADLTSDIARAMVRGYQGATLGPKSVALIFKHFPGGGPAIAGQDSHFEYGKYAVYPGKNLEYHVKPFKAAIDAGAVAIMPYYSIPKDITTEQVGMSYSKEIVTDLLRNRLGFTGVVNSDSGITTSMVWGVESLTVEQRYKKGIDAGVDIYSNDATPEYVVNLVKKGELTEARVNESARRILRVRIGLGIFENPYADAENAERIIRSAEFQKQGLVAQRKSVVLLSNDRGVLPLKAGARVYAEGVDAKALTARGFIVAASPEDADVALLRVVRGGGEGAPGAGRRGGGPGGAGAGSGSGAGAGANAGAGGARGGPGGGPGGAAAQAPRGFGLGGMATGGSPIDLTIAVEQLQKIRTVMGAKPTVVAMYFDRPYVVPELAKEAGALVAHFGVTDEALLDVLAGAVAPTGKLPFELPSSMDAVRAQKEDVPHDSKAPLFPLGHGLTFTAGSARR
jgi:beta-glucosidase